MNPHVWKKYLVARSGRYLFCVNRHTGKDLWRYECSGANLSIAVGVGRVFCAELVNPRRKETEGEVVKMRAFRIDTGKLLWETGGGSALRYSDWRPLCLSPRKHLRTPRRRMFLVRCLSSIGVYSGARSTGSCSEIY
ncbi:MAG: hypothetical protein ACYSU3_13925 [Planctomycetota bacterium]